MPVVLLSYWHRAPLALLAVRAERHTCSPCGCAGIAFSGWFLERKLGGDLERLQERQASPPLASVQLPMSYAGCKECAGRGACMGVQALANFAQSMLCMLVQAERLREILTSLGPAFVKIGQVTGPNSADVMPYASVTLSQTGSPMQPSVSACI